MQGSKNRFFKESLTQWVLLGFGFYWVFFGQAGKIGKIIQKKLKALKALKQ